MHMLKNIAKTTLKTLDEITMTLSVDEKKLLFEPKNDSNEPEKETMMEDEAAATKVAADAAAAALAATVATTDNVVSVEDEQEKKQEEKNVRSDENPLYGQYYKVFFYYWKVS